MRKISLIVSLCALVFTSVIALPARQPAYAQATTTTNCPDSSATTDTGAGEVGGIGEDAPDPKPLFAPQDDKFRFTITLPRLGWRFECENLLTRVINFVVDTLTLVVGGVAFGYVIYGGIRYMTAAADPARADGAKKTIIGAIIGIVIVAVAYIIVELVIRATVTGNLF